MEKLKIKGENLLAKIKNVYFDNDIEYRKLDNPNKKKLIEKIKDFVKTLYFKTGEVKKD